MVAIFSRNAFLLQGLLNCKRNTFDQTTQRETELEIGLQRLGKMGVGRLPGIQKVKTTYIGIGSPTRLGNWNFPVVGGEERSAY